MSKRTTVDPSIRFWAKVNKTETCWVWIAGKTPSGYGSFGISTGRSVYAHRFAYESEHGPIPDGHVIDHRCHARDCVRPSHLRAITQKQNTENRGARNTNNTSGVRGVTWDKDRGLWSTQVMHNRKVYTAGRFSSIEEAAAAIVELRNLLHTHNDLDRIKTRAHA